MFRVFRFSRPIILNNVRFRHRSYEIENKELTGMKWILLGIPLTSFGLGCWQVQRREWKLNLLKTLEEKIGNEPVDLPEDLWELNTLEYCPVRVKGRFLHDREIIMGPRPLIKEGGKENHSGSLMSSSKNQGWLVITPFQLSNREEIIMINRGWVPNSMKNPDKRPEGQVTYEIDLIGTVRSTEKRPQFVPKNDPKSGYWFYKDFEEMARLTGSAPILLDAKGSSDMPKGWPIPNQTRVNYRNEHLSYLITWFTLSAFTSYMWIRKFILKKG